MTSNLAVEINNLTKIYNKGKNLQYKALDNINLKIEKGKFFGLLGPNGAGKSTLINCLSTVVKKTTGTILLSSHDLDKAPFLAKKSIGIVPQELNFDPFFTPLQILMLIQGFYGITPNKLFCYNLLHLLGLKGKENVKIRSLSGGMKRRVLIAKTLVHSPDIVVLDEPTAGVDVELRKNIWKRLKEINKQGTTIILTTHYLEEAEYLCEEIAIINKGKIIANDKTSNLIQKLGSKFLIISIEGYIKEIPKNINSYYTKRIGNKLYFNYTDDKIVGIIIKELINQDFIINSVKTVEANLEDVFLKLVDDTNVPVAQ